jgi:predicted nucleic acid-binding protein
LVKQFLEGLAKGGDEQEPPRKAEASLRQKIKTLRGGDRLPRDTAAGLIAAWTRFRVQPINLQILGAALRVREAHGFSYWDRVIVAQALGCDELYTEDMQHGRYVGAVTIVNPFR